MCVCVFVVCTYCAGRRAGKGVERFFLLRAFHNLVRYTNFQNERSCSRAQISVSFEDLGIYIYVFRGEARFSF